jgi:hypothetical protein
VQIAGTTPSVNGIEIEIASRFVSLWKATQRFAERIKRRPTRRAAVTGGTSPPGGSLNRVGSINPWQTAPQWGSTLDNGGRVPTPRNLQGPGRDNSIYYWLRD